MIKLDDALYILRVMAAFTLALGASYVMQLDSPGSAAGTVLIVASPIRGAILSKSFWRVMGSIAGGAAAVGLMAAFSQSPYLFIIGMAIWLGVCTAISSLLRYFRSYGAVLAGYTVSLIAFSAVSRPDRIFEIALSRVAVVTIGVLSCAIVFLVTAPTPTRPQVRKHLAEATRQSLGLLCKAVGGETERALLVERHAVGATIVALDQSIEFAAAEDAAVAKFAGNVRLAAANLFGMILGGLYTIDRLRVTAPAIAARMATWLQTADPAQPDSETFKQLSAPIMADWPDLDLAAQTALDQARTLVGQLSQVMETLDALDHGRITRAAPILPIYVNPSTALRNGLRAAIAMILAGWFWFNTSWNEGGMMMALLGPMSSLLAQSDSASAASMGFLIGTILTTIAGFFCTFAVLPHMTDFPMEMMGILPFIAVGLWFSVMPRWNSVAVPYLIFFMSMVGGGNPMRYDMTSYINNAIGFIVGAGFGVLTFRILLPPDPIAEAAFLSRSIARALRRLAKKPESYSFGWEHLQHQKLTRLSRRLAPFPARRIDAVQDAEDSLLIARRIGQLGALRDQPGLPSSLAAMLAELMPKLAELKLTPDEAAARYTPLARETDPASRQTATYLFDLSTLIQRRNDRRRRLKEIAA